MTAHNNDSIAPSIAMANAGPINFCINENDIVPVGVNDGSLFGNPPKTDPMVSTWENPKIACAVIPKSSANNGVGNFLNRDRSAIIMMTNVAIPKNVVCQFIVRNA